MIGPFELIILLGLAFAIVVVIAIILIVRSLGRKKESQTEKDSPYTPYNSI